MPKSTKTARKTAKKIRYSIFSELFSCTSSVENWVFCKKTFGNFLGKWAKNGLYLVCFFKIWVSIFRNYPTRSMKYVQNFRILFFILFSSHFTPSFYVNCFTYFIDPFAQPLKTGSIYSLSRIDTLPLCQISHLGVKICSTKHLHARRTFLPRENHLIHTKLDFKINFAFICTA